MPREVIQQLSPRENQIILLAAEGHTDSSIASKLGISEGTIGTYWGRIRTKLGPYPRTELIAMCIRNELQVKLEEIKHDRDLLAGLLHNAVDAELMYEDIVDAADEGVVVVTDDGLIEHANPLAHAIFGYDHGSLKGRPLATLVPPRFRDAHKRGMDEYCQDPREWKRSPHMDTYGLCQDGTEVPLHVTISAVHRGERLLLSAFFRGAERKEAFAAQ